MFQSEGSVDFALSCGLRQNTFIRIHDIILFYPLQNPPFAWSCVNLDYRTVVHQLLVKNAGCRLIDYAKHKTDDVRVECNTRSECAIRFSYADLSGAVLACPRDISLFNTSIIIISVLYQCLLGKRIAAKASSLLKSHVY